MAATKRNSGIAPGWWTLLLVVFVIAAIWLSFSLFTGSLRSTVPVTLTSDRSGLVMETNAKVKLRGVQVGKVAAISGGDTESASPVKLRLDIDPDQIRFIPSMSRPGSGPPRSSAPNSSTWCTRPIRNPNG